METCDAPMVTVIVPVYNVADYVGECLESVQGQTLRNWEAICIHDCSTDGSLAVLESYAADDKRIKVLENPVNRGVSYSRNRGMEQASGKYLYFLDADDMIAPNALEDLYEIAEKDALDGVFFDATHVAGTDEVFEMPWGKPTGAYDRVVRGNQFFWQTIAKVEHIAPVWMQFWRTGFLRSNRISFSEELRKAEDVLFTFEAFLLAERVRCIRKSFHTYRKRETSLTGAVNRKTIDSFQSAFMVSCEMLRFLASYADKLEIEDMGEMEAYVRQYTLLSQKLHIHIAQPQKLSFSNPMHELMYRKFCRDMSRRRQTAKLLFRAYDKNRLVCACDKEWEERLRDIYGIDVTGFIMIEPESKRIVLDDVLQKAESGSIQMYFSVYYEKLKPALLSLQMREDVDFMDGRILLED